MKKIILLCLSGILTVISFSQSVTQKLAKAFQQFENDEQLKYAISSLYVIDAKSGQVVFDKNSQVGLAPASTQKIITATTAFELLGKNFAYNTLFLTDKNGLYVLGTGDPTLGSWRYTSTSATSIFEELVNSFKKKRKESISRFVLLDNEFLKNVPSGWIYEDMANYYGAPAKKLNWHENQQDIYFIPGRKEGEETMIDTLATVGWKKYINHCKTGKPGSGDNAYVYFEPGGTNSFIEGTVPAAVKRFSISATDNFPNLTFSIDLIHYLAEKNLYTGGWDVTRIPPLNPYYNSRKDTLCIHRSPSLDSIVYWFLKKSINLYGEALIKTISTESKGSGTTDDGVKAIKNFWQKNGIDADELNITDGSGLSPQNRVTTHAQVQILKYAKSKDWFPYFYDALPEYNGMKMKSGTIHDVKGFCGYQQAKDGKEYIFSFLVNNYNGSTVAVVRKMYKVLDGLK